MPNYIPTIPFKTQRERNKSSCMALGISYEPHAGGSEKAPLVM